MDKITAQTRHEQRIKTYRDLKEKHTDAIILVRCGDFYETFDDDAEKTSLILGITLTKHSVTKDRITVFPHHALDIYLPKLIRAGHRIAICDGDNF